MQRKSYDRRERRLSYPAVMSTLAVIIATIALCGVGGAIAGGTFITSKQIKNGSIRAADLHTNAVNAKAIGNNAVSTAEIKDDAVGATDIGAGQVNSEAIGTGQVTSTDIGNGEVTPQDVTMPEPQQLAYTESAGAEVGAEFVKLADVGAYSKQDGSSVLEVTWTGTVGSPVGAGCIFQIRVNGQASSSGGLVFLQSDNANATSVSATALFDGLSTGPVTPQIWARSTNPSLATQCQVGPPIAGGIPQTFVVGETVL